MISTSDVDHLVWYKMVQEFNPHGHQIFTIKKSIMPIFVLFWCRELISYSDSTIPLAETDFDAISKTKACSNHLENNESDKKDLSCSLDGVDDPKVQFNSNSDALPTQVALKLGFTLPSSCYATMAIRELLKTSTSVRNTIYHS